MTLLWREGDNTEGLGISLHTPYTSEFPKSPAVAALSPPVISSMRCAGDKNNFHELWVGVCIHGRGACFNLEFPSHDGKPCPRGGRESPFPLTSAGHKR